jgi:DNA repair exonuclease SbcCD ATPase subunit
MTNQLELENSEIQTVIDEIAYDFENALPTLLEDRDERYEAEIAPLDAEISRLESERFNIGEAARNLEKLLPAQARKSQRKADELLLAGKADEAEAKLQEARQAAAAPAAMEERRRAINNRITAIEEEKRRIASRVFDEWYAEVQKVVRVAERGFFSLLDGLETSFYDFQERTGTQQSGMLLANRINDLTADVNTREWKSGTKWYRGRN